MEHHLSKRALSIKPSITLTISAKAKVMKADGIDVLNFSAGEPDFDTPDTIKQAAFAAIDKGFTKYTAAGGIPELKEEIIAKYQLFVFRCQQLLRKAGRGCGLGIFLRLPSGKASHRRYPRSSLRRRPMHPFFLRHR